MNTKINCSLTPEFIKPFTTKSKVWKPNKVPNVFYREFQSLKIKKLMDNVVFPREVKDVLTRLDNISANNNELFIDCPITKNLIFAILCHENSKYIKKLKFKFLNKVSIEELRARFRKRIDDFKMLFKADVPDSMIELYGFYESFKSVLDEKIKNEKYWMGTEDYFDLNGGDCILGIFKSLFLKQGEIEKDVILSLRFTHHCLSYFPVFNYNSDYVTQGFVFDLHLNEFTSFAYCGDGEYGEAKGLWPAFFSKIKFFGDSDVEFAFYEFFEENDNSLNNVDNISLTYEELTKYIDEISSLWIWFINFFLAEYLNINEVPDLEFSRVNKLRYSDSLIYDPKNSIEFLRKNKKFYVSDTFPKMVISIEEHFHPLFDYDQLQKLLSVFSLTGDIDDLKTFLESKPKISDVLPLDIFYIKDQVKEMSDEIWNDFYKTIIEFAKNESEKGRHGLSLLLGLLIWDQAETEEISDYAVNLLKDLPDEVCHPLIKDVATMNGKTRFHRTFI